MQEKNKRIILTAKIFLFTALGVFVLGNLVAIFIYYVCFLETPSYSAEAVMNPIGSLAFLGMMLTQIVGCTLTAGIGNLLSIIFSSISLSFSSKAIRACSETPHFLKPTAVTLLIVSIIALLLTIPTYVLLSFFLGI